MQHRRRILLIGLGVVLGGCSEQRSTSPSSEGTSPPSIVSIDNGAADGDSDNEMVCSNAPPGSSAVRLLTRAEYDRTVRDLLGDPSAPATRNLPIENALTGFENDAANHRATPLLVEGYLRLAEEVASRAMSDRSDMFMPCTPDEVGDTACAEMFVEVFGQRAFRRPLTSTEQTRLLDVYHAMHAPFGFRKSVELTLQAMLVSPQFLYRIDVGSPQTAGDNVVLVSPWEMASRLSYFLWGTMPDDELFAAAASGSLFDVREVEVQAWRMMADPRALESISSFFRQWLGLDRLANVTKDAQTFPELPQGMNARWRASMEAFLQRVVWEGSGTVHELLTSNVMVVDALTAPLYDLEGPSHEEVVAREAPSGTRAGLLTQPGLLALLSNSTQSSPIRRGVFIREKLMCQPISPPPPGVVIEPPPADPSLTTRERFAAHTNNEECAGCHVMIDPIGFGLERYDALGRFRETENGLPVDDSGELAYTTDPSIEGPYRGAVALAEKLAASKQVKDCILGHVLTFAFGRVPDEDLDQCTLERLREQFSEDGALRELFVAIAISDAFRTTVAP